VIEDQGARSAGQVKFVPVAGNDELGEGGLHGVNVGTVPVLLVRLGGHLYALGRICTHAYADLAEGSLEDGCVVCPLHGSKFDLRTGKALTLPAIESEPVYKVRIENDVIYVALPDPKP
jgi:3-phenylpropionate/trans-cinnamate dioxygenase ferredoxin subunit